MDFGANWAYKEIDVKVSGTLQEAADILRKMKEEKANDKEKSLISRNFSGISITSTESHKTISISSIHRSSSKEPKPTIRTPRDAGKNRKILFPKAVIVNSKKEASLVSASYADSSNESSVDPITPIPDSENLFPEAIYIPANKGKTKIDVAVGRSRESGDSIRSIQRKHVQQMGQEPLEDIQHLKRRGLKKSKPDGLFPSATYIAGGGKPKMTMSPLTSEIQSSVARTTNTDNSLLYEQMEFISTNGRFKMCIQPLEKKKKKSDEFPIVPKQLQSSTRLKIESQKIKFSAQISLGTDHFIDLSGIFNGSSMKKNDVTNLVINGQSYSTY
ncbi:hypothetical protein CRE_19442 [Caenorhabditis remanei]|uniref:Uncharacterized protein n=1 Tax=Caenorhabditis remanei TaxID=31234 RepID=E3NA01_CAERE|nr:hypothetical protein CRE_19442 [Caenorhabditis remanei]